MKHFQPPMPIKRKDATDASDEGDIGALQKSVDKLMDDTKNFAEDMIKKVNAGADVTDELKKKADESMSDFNAVKGRIDDLEQKLVSGQKDQGPERSKSAGELLVETDGFKSAASSKKVSFDVEVKAVISSATTDTDGAAGAAVPRERLPGIQSIPDGRLTVRDLLTPGRMDTSTIEYVQETGFNNNAAAVAEGAAKPQSDIKFSMKTETAKVIAHHMKASRQVLDDASALRSHIDHRLRWGLAYAEEELLLNGDGLDERLHGVFTQASEYAPSFAPTNETMIDKLRLAMLQAFLAEFPATGHVLNPIDWTRIVTTKDGDGRYIIGQPQGDAPHTMWNLPVVESPKMEEDKFLTGAFKLGAQIFDRWETRIEVSNSNDDDFTKNRVTILAEERLALAVYRPEAFIRGDFGNVA